MRSGRALAGAAAGLAVAALLLWGAAALPWPAAGAPSWTGGVALLARCAGLLGHIAEEQRDPIGMDIYTTVDRNADYRPAKHS